MDIQQFREYCLSKPGSSECMPFDDTTLVFKVGGKMFALLSLELDKNINLKCDPERAVQLREQYACITPGYHMNKTHWNSMPLDGSLKPELIRELLDHSFNLIFNSLSAKKRKDVEEEGLGRSV